MEFNTKDIIIYSTLVILVILVIYLLVKQKKNNENFDVNNVNTSAINNLGKIAAQLMTPNPDGTTGTLTIPADTTACNALTATTFNLLPTGLIVAWNNASTIPSGWILCDGNNNTPDLRGRFILGAGVGGNDMNNNPLPEQTFGTNGGEVNHTLVIAEMPKHNHNLATMDYNTGGSSTNAYRSQYGSLPQTSYQGGDAPHNNMPPYYVLVYIMKL